MKKIIIVYFALLNTICLCQTNSFSKIYAPYGNDSSKPFSAHAIVSNGNGYVVCAIGHDNISTAYNNQELYFYNVDSIGNFGLINKYFKSGYDYYTFYGSLIRTKDNGYCFVGDIDNGIGVHYIMRFDSNMDTVWTKILAHDTIWEAVRQIKETSDHGFILTGSRQLSDYECDVPIIKTDSLGNQLWKTYISTGYYGNAGQIEETPDHGFLICGYRSSFTTGYGDPFIIKTDSAGNLEWLKILGNTNQLDGDAALAITQDSNYIIALGYGTSTVGNNDYWYGRLNIIKYSPDGTQIWNRMYDTIRLDIYVSKLQILPNNDFIVMGSTVAGTDTNYYATFMFKFNANGDSLWRRIYSYTTNFIDGNYLYDNVLNSDGSITACGYVSGSTLIPSQQIWILKTDSNGYAPGCEPTGIEEIYQILNKGEVRVYPNPATNQTTIAYPQLKEEGSIHIYNMLGQIVHEEKIAKGSSQTILSIQHLKAGLYKVIIREKGMMIGEVSLVKE